MMYQFFFVLAMLFALAFTGLIACAIWRVLAGSHLKFLRNASRGGTGELEEALERIKRASLLQRLEPGDDGGQRGIIATAAQRDRYLVGLTAFSINRSFRAVALALLALAGAAALAVAALGFQRGGPVYILDAFLLALIVLATWIAVVLLGRIHDQYEQALNILVEALEVLGVAREEALTLDAGPQRSIRIVLIFSVAFLLLWVSRYLLIIFLDLNVSGTLGFLLNFGSIFVFFLGLLVTMFLLNRDQWKKDGA